MATDVNETYGGDHFVVSTNIELILRTCNQYNVICQLYANKKKGLNSKRKREEKEKKNPHDRMPRLVPLRAPGTSQTEPRSLRRHLHGGPGSRGVLVSDSAHPRQASPRRDHLPTSPNGALVKEDNKCP